MPGKRKHLRLPLTSHSFLELQSPGLGDASHGVVLACNTRNVSRGGLLLSLEQEVTVGAILQIGVDLPAASDTLYLVGEVRWCTAASNADEQAPGWYAGFQILNARDTDIARWVELIGAMETSQAKPPGGRTPLTAGSSATDDAAG